MSVGACDVCGSDSHNRWAHSSKEREGADRLEHGIIRRSKKAARRRRAVERKRKRRNRGDG